MGLLQICLAGVLWGTGGVVLQLVRAETGMSALTASAYRMLIAAVTLLAVVAVLRRTARLLALVRSSGGAVVLVGAGTATYQSLYFASVVEVGVSVATAVSLGLAPSLLTVVDAGRARTPPDGRHLLLLLTALTGLVAVSGSAGGATTGPRPAVGVLLAVASSTAYAVTTCLGRAASQRSDPMVLAAVTTTVGSGALALALWASGGGVVVAVDAGTLGALAYLGVVTMAVAHGLLYAGLRTTSSTAAVLACLLEPVAAALLAAVVLDERLPPVGAVGIALVLVGVGGTALAGRGERVAGRRPAVGEGRSLPSRT